MEYEFRRDLTGRVEARFSMGHEAMGSWLLAEPAARADRLESLFSAITALQTKECWEFNLPGQEFNLRLTRTDASVRSTVLPEEDCEDMPEDDDMDFYDQELCAECGLDDFKTMLDAWQTFNLRG
ncbi:hypothetical protein GZ77_16185 [Endozoicomonas montiporae]|uniref:Uncharacterized protein n=2 Tax=Endozoicomonas montiporae TaxID=1027273 RepID=A0A081N5U0_9GAMM|nr:YacL family protein [Endozoicomonas montiporae]AMO57287.1 hypothetical protein EZMO1_3288 [Endozoicomonas montiporae CL-33]KEQ13813.1 hypothetical protein GZ77_16185 [Endozoicomonas montiporae]